MKINADLQQPAQQETVSMEWVPSPMAGVERKMLDRHDAETGRATSLVRYAPESYFSAHIHNGGEEFFVLDGVFSDEHGDYPAGTYVRNPIGSSHTPFSKNGCTIFVKLWQFAKDDTVQKSIDTQSAAWDTMTAGVESLTLHEFEAERVQLLRFQSGVSYSFERTQGLELLLISGQLQGEDGILKKGDWVRLPSEGKPLSVSVEEDTLLYCKQGHL